MMKLTWTKRQVILILLFNPAYVICGICHSVQAPFYPKEAEGRGVSPSQYGFVFGIFYLTSFIVGPLCGKAIGQVGPMFLVHMGLFIAGVTSILFGFLDKINKANIFLTFSLIMRVTESIGITAFLVAGYSIFSSEFSNNVATAFATLQSSFCLGLIIGPTIGGALVEWMGFLAPFLFTGVLLLTIAIISVILFQKVDEPTVHKQSRKGFCVLLQQPEMLLAMSATFVPFLHITFLQVTLEPHLRIFEMQPVQVGAMFIIHGMSEALLAPVWGRICDKWIPPQLVWSFGAILLIISLLLLGPAPYFPFDLSLPLCICSLIIHGIGFSAEVVSSFYCYSKVAVKIGFPDDVTTYGIASAFFSSASSLGGFIAPSMGGFLYDSIGFSWAVHVLISFQIILFVFTLLYNFLKVENNFPKFKDFKSNFKSKSNISKKETMNLETQPILPNENTTKNKKKIKRASAEELSEQKEN